MAELLLLVPSSLGPDRATGILSFVTNTTPPAPGRVQRILAYMIASAVGVAVVSFVAVIIATAAGVRDFGEGVWPFVYMLVPVALVFGFVLLIALLIVTAVQRSRASKDARG